MGYGPLIKYGLIVAAFLAFCGGLIAYGSHRKQIEWDAAISVQAIQAAESVIAEAENTAKIETRYVTVQGKTKTVIKTVEKEVVKYVESPAKKCELDTEFERTFDRVSGMLDADENGVSAPAGATGDPAPSGAPPVTTAEVLSAYYAAIAQYRALSDTYAALVEWTRSSYALAQEGAGR